MGRLAFGYANFTGLIRFKDIAFRLLLCRHSTLFDLPSSNQYCPSKIAVLFYFYLGITVMNTVMSDDIVILFWAFAGTTI